LGDKEVQPKLMASQHGALPQFENEQNCDQHYRSGEQKRNHPRDFVSVAEAVQK
jgi:hypothetical protein